MVQLSIYIILLASHQKLKFQVIAFKETIVTVSPENGPKRSWVATFVRIEDWSLKTGEEFI